MSKKKRIINSMQAAAVVLGGYVNGYSIIRELHAHGVRNIWLLDTSRSLASYSNRICGFLKVAWSPDSLRQVLTELHKKYSYLILFPTHDEQLEALHAVYDDLSHFCFLPFNRNGLMSCLDKNIQYQYCETLGIPYPRSVELSSEQSLLVLERLAYPLLVKPKKRDDATTDVFRNMLLRDASDLERKRDVLLGFMHKGIGFLASELIPGDDIHIYAYTAYRSPNGKILNEWVGRKLTQYPDNFGVFSSASNQAPEAVRELGRALVDGMDLHGIAEPEFKYDTRDSKFKLMEVNLRSMMWNRVGNLSGVYLQLTQWQDALGLPVQQCIQEEARRIHFVYMKHEIANLISRWGYWRNFKHNIFGGDERHYAIWDWRDIKPAIRDLQRYPRIMVASWLRHLRRH